MKSKFRVRPIDLMIVLAIALYAGWKVMSRPPRSADGPSTFARQVDLTPLDRTAVAADGRLRSFASHAKTYMGYVSGPRKINGQSNGFTYLDLILRPERYTDVDIIYVKNKQVRSQIVDALMGHPQVDQVRAESIEKSGLISRSLLNEPSVRALLERLGKDLIRTAKVVNAINQAVFLADARFLADNLRVVPPPNGLVETSWISLSAIANSKPAPLDATHAGMNAAMGIPGLDEEFQEQVRQTWSNLATAWRSENVTDVNRYIATLARLFPTISPQLYPSSGRLAMESWYFRNKSMTWVWLIYLAGVVPLLMSVIYKWDRARGIGMVMFAIAFGFHTASLLIRWYISGRWPNANMFEAVTTAAWFGGVGALILEWIARRTPLRNLFALGSAVMSMVALMAAYFLPAQLDSTISNKMAALNDIWLYIHTNMIIWSYGVIGMACVPALLMLRYRWCVKWDDGAIPKARLLLLPVALVVLNYTGYRLLMHLIASATFELTGPAWLAVSFGFAGSAFITLFELMAARERVAAGGVVAGRAASGGASGILTWSSSTGQSPKGERPQPDQVLDGATMVLVELAFIMLWTGTVMGAVWADHSWGRPWGWDPKEVFALNTFMIFLILIHVRLKVRDKAFWTATLAVIGFEVMMFNWIVVNFVITGLHSYA